ncbi:LuxR C-terminal-related transcriptional regulator [Streptomyces sp. NPDC048279]|uniref:LuxR C-terminal-related transcriptional regulator n=1 Tax=Streptomyces sp. NPDC048279 TaxID=3154714 RepID=UPI00341C9E56
MGAMLQGRGRETKEIADLLGAARTGRGGTLVVRGPAGIGKTALLDWALGAAPDFRLLRATGIEFEMELAFAGLHQLLAPLLDRLPRLPGPQREALETAFGRLDGAVSDRLLVGMAVLTLLSEAAEEQPVLCVVDDAQWLEQATMQALVFAARRIAAERVVLLLGLRDPVQAPELDRLPTLSVGPLPDSEARELLAGAVHAPLDNQVRDRIIGEARGNPLALLELAPAKNPAELAGGFGLLLHGDDTIEDLYRRRLTEVPAETRRLLLAAAAEPLGDPVLLWRAAEQLGIRVTAAAEAEKAGLLEIDARVHFRHPLVRSAVYRLASPEERRTVHRALAEVTDARLDPDRQAWHRAQAAYGPDEDVAAELVRSAGRARARGGVAAAAAFLERSMVLTPDANDRLERLLAAAEAKLEAGIPDKAAELLGTADDTAMNPLLCARAEVLRGRIAFAVQRGADAPSLLLRAAQRLEPLAICLARETHLDALYAAISVGTLGEDAQAFAASARAVAPPPGALRTVDLLLDGLALVLTGERRKAVPMLRQAVSDPTDDVWAVRPHIASLVSLELWDLQPYRAVLKHQIDSARATGAITSLIPALGTLAGASLPTGKCRSAEGLLDESDELAAATGNIPLVYPRLHLAALRGDGAQATKLINTTIDDATARGEGLLVAYGNFTMALLRNGLTDYVGAYDAARLAVDQLQFGFLGLALRELVEAAAYAGRPEEAAAALARLREHTLVAGTDWALGIGSSCSALLADGEAADHYHRNALHHLSDSGCDADLARAGLLYGEWLRREGRRLEARRYLRAAHELLSAMGAAGYASRAAHELRATGERVRSTSPEAQNELTPQELHVAHLVAKGKTSKEIAAELFVSPRTIDAHLRHIFRKLDITSRRQLRGMSLSESDDRLPTSPY